MGCRGAVRQRRHCGYCSLAPILARYVAHVFFLALSVLVLVQPRPRVVELCPLHRERAPARHWRGCHVVVDIRRRAQGSIRARARYCKSARALHGRRRADRRALSTSPGPAAGLPGWQLDRWIRTSPLSLSKLQQGGVKRCCPQAVSWTWCCKNGQGDRPTSATTATRNEQRERPRSASRRRQTTRDTAYSAVDACPVSSLLSWPPLLLAVHSS